MQFINPQKVLRGMPVQGEIPTNKELITNAVRMAWPAILESFLVALVGMIDTVMVSSLGAYAIAAVGLTTQPKFIGLAVFLSLNVAISAIVARRKGENNRVSANRALVQALMITVGLTILVTTLCLVFADPVIHLAGSAADTHDSAVTYFKIIMGAMCFNTISLVINAAQRGAGNTKIAMRTNVVSNLVNLVFNYLLIGGNFGFPALGVAGAAIATVLGSMVACGMSIYSVLHHDQFLSLRSVNRKDFRFDKLTMTSITKIGSSTLAEQIFLRIGFLLYSLVVAKLGTTEFAAHQIGMNFMSISFSFGDGLSVAAVALVGQSLGAKRKDMAKIYGSICQRLGLAFATVLCSIFILCGRYFFMLYTGEQVILDYGAQIMVILAFVVFLQISQVIFSGCLRGGGDTIFTAFVSLVSVAIIRPGAGWLFCYPLGLGLIGAWIGLFVDQAMRFCLTYFRFKSGKWLNMRV